MNSKPKYIMSEKQKARNYQLGKRWRKNLENKVRLCDCGQPSVMWYTGGWACRSCIDRDKSYFC